MNTEGNEVFLDITQSYLKETYKGNLFPQGAIVFPKNGGAVLTNKRRILKYTSVVDLNTGVYISSPLIYNSFVNLIFQTIDFGQYFKGSAIPTIDRKTVENYYIGLPPFAEQQRIVDKVNSIFATIDSIGTEQSDLQVLTDDIQKRVLDLAIRGKLVAQDPADEPAPALIERIRAEKEALVKAGKIRRDKADSYIYKGDDNSYYEKLGAEIKNIDEFLPFQIPDNWIWVRVKHISSAIQYGLSNSAETHGNYKFLRITDIQDNTVIWKNVPYTQIPENEATQFVLHNDDLLFARTGGTVGKSFLVSDLKEKPVFASYLIRIQTLGVYIKFIKAFFESEYYWYQITDKAAGTGQPNVNGTKLGDLFLPLPPLLEQKRIVAQINSLFNQMQLFKN